jgi:cyclic pyranopterin phosphate synthase
MSTENKLTHIDEQDRAAMVDVGHKKPQLRVAKACGHIALDAETLHLITENKIRKGNVLAIAEIAGIQAAKQTSGLIPLCHPLPLTKVRVNAQVVSDGVEVQTEACCVGQTGVEMEALTAASVALLTVYDMCKAVDKTMIMGNVRLLEKTKTDIE